MITELPKTPKISTENNAYTDVSVLGDFGTRRAHDSHRYASETDPKLSALIERFQIGYRNINSGLENQNLHSALTGDPSRVRFESGYFEGPTRRGRPHGHGIVITDDGVVVAEGEYKWGKLWNGWGEKLTNLGKEKGDFVEGQLSGRGSRVEGERTEVGEFVQGRLNGLGAVIGPETHLAIGEFMEGQFIDGIRLRGHRLEEGRFLNGFLNGRGKACWSEASEILAEASLRAQKTFHEIVNKCHRSADFSKIKKHLKLAIFDSVEEGYFKDGRLSGEGSRTVKGVTQKGAFENGRLLPTDLPLVPELSYSCEKTPAVESGGVSGHPDVVTFKFGDQASLTFKLKADGGPTSIELKNSSFKIDAEIERGRVAETIKVHNSEGSPLEASIMVATSSGRGRYVLEDGGVFEGVAYCGQMGTGVLVDRYGATWSGDFRDGSLIRGSLRFLGVETHLENGRWSKANCGRQLALSRVLSYGPDGDTKEGWLAAGTITAHGFASGQCLILRRSSVELGNFMDGRPHGLLTVYSRAHYSQRTYSQGEISGPGCGVAQKFDYYDGHFTVFNHFTGFCSENGPRNSQDAPKISFYLQNEDLDENPASSPKDEKVTVFDGSTNFTLGGSKKLNDFDKQCMDGQTGDNICKGEVGPIGHAAGRRSVCCPKRR